VSAFSDSWLSLREPADRRARDPALLAAVAAYMAGRDAVIVTDLGCGTGATLRALAPHLPPHQTWRLVDHDPALLASAGRAAGALAGSVSVTAEPLRADLQADIEAVVARDADLVTTSAFLDLVSEEWITRLVGAAAAHRRPVYAALSYDGRVGCLPADPLDEAVLEAFNRHQRRDKGLGGALGPAAAGVAARRFEAAGFAVATAPADWLLMPHETRLQEQLLEGWHHAVAETGLMVAHDLDAWLGRRRTAIADGRSRLRVGHVDLWAEPQPIR
jgi:SAM-dependent methyltransferase